MMLVQIYGDNESYNNRSTPLQDTGFSLLNIEKPLPSVYADISVLASMIGMILYSLVRKECVLVLRRALFTMGMIYLMRSFTLLWTQLPSPNPHCSSMKRTGSAAWITALHAFFSGQVFCSDLIFSGHTASLVTFTWITCSLSVPLPASGSLNRIMRTGVYATRLLSTVLAMVGIFFILAGRLHYTVDVVAAIIVALLSNIVVSMCLSYATILLLLHLKSGQSVSTSYTSLSLTEQSADKEQLFGFKDASKTVSALHISPSMVTYLVLLVGWIDCLDQRLSKEYNKVTLASSDTTLEAG
jgi:hypothetical protein